MKTSAQERRALEQRKANAVAKAAGKPLAYPNPWDSRIRKLPADASTEDRMRWHRDFALQHAPKK